MICMLKNPGSNLPRYGPIIVNQAIRPTLNNVLKAVIWEQNTAFYLLNLNKLWFINVENY